MGKPKRSQRQKSAKPYPDFPLTFHAGSNQWCKKIRGQIHYFGTDADTALRKYLDERDALQAGRLPRHQNDEITIRDLVNHYLTYKKSLVATGELSERTFHDYHVTCGRIVEHFGAWRVVDDLQPVDFTGFRGILAEGRGLHALAREVRQARMVFRFAEEEGLTERHIRFGKSFREPSLRTRRQHRQSQQQKHGDKMFEASEIREVLENVNDHLHAMILMGINCGFGQTDFARLPESAIDFKRGWVNFPRPKTGVERRCPLWPETIRALERSQQKRTQATEDEFTGLMFLTRYGTPVVRQATRDDGGLVLTDRVGQQFSKNLKNLGLKRPGVNFYALRHTFETVAGECRDQVAVDAIMGHVDATMASLYRERISDKRLNAVTDFVRNWLLRDSPDLFASSTEVTK